MTDINVTLAHLVEKNCLGARLERQAAAENTQTDTDA
jgi:hypothetical protein